MLSGAPNTEEISPLSTSRRSSSGDCRRVFAFFFSFFSPFLFVRMQHERSSSEQNRPTPSKVPLAGQVSITPVAARSFVRAIEDFRLISFPGLARVSCNCFYTVAEVFIFPPRRLSNKRLNSVCDPFLTEGTVFGSPEHRALLGNSHALHVQSLWMLASPSRSAPPLSYLFFEPRSEHPRPHVPPACVLSTRDELLGHPLS